MVIRLIIQTCCLDAICPPYLATFRDLDLFPPVATRRITENGLFERIPLPFLPLPLLLLRNARKSSPSRSCPFVPVCVRSREIFGGEIAVARHGGGEKEEVDSNRFDLIVLASVSVSREEKYIPLAG